MIYDLSLKGNKLFINKKIDAATQELDLIFGTETTELLCDQRFGSNFLSFLWTSTPSASTLAEYVKEKIQQCPILSEFETDVMCNFDDESNDPAYFVQIFIYQNNTDTPIRRTFTLKNNMY